MPTWDSSQYLIFANQRTQPCRDLVQRIELTECRNAIDLGCGPGNSTGIIAERWPGMELMGLDTSREMLQAARAKGPKSQWVMDDIGHWARTADARYGLVFSNAALQWVDDHSTLLPRLMLRVAAGGALAIQMPANFDAPAHTLMRQIAASKRWSGIFGEKELREWHVHEPAFYYEVLSKVSARLELWETEYLHIMPSAAAIVDWYKGTGLRPFLDALENDQQRDAFATEYLEGIERVYPRREDGNVLFPFRRLFIIAYQN